MSKRKDYRRKTERRIAKPGVTTRHDDADGFTPKRVKRGEAFLIMDDIDPGPIPPASKVHGLRYVLDNPSFAEWIKDVGIRPLSSTPFHRAILARLDTEFRGKGKPVYDIYDSEGGVKGQKLRPELEGEIATEVLSPDLFVTMTRSWVINPMCPPDTVILEDRYEQLLREIYADLKRYQERTAMYLWGDGVLEYIPPFAATYSTSEPLDPHEASIHVMKMLGFDVRRPAPAYLPGDRYRRRMF